MLRQVAERLGRSLAAAFEVYDLVIMASEGLDALAREDLVAVARMMMVRTATTARTRSIELTWDEGVPEWLGEQAFADTTYSGARPLRQLISQHIEDAMVDTTYQGGAGRSQAGRTVHVSVRDGSLIIQDSAAATLEMVGAEA